jgi:polyisoprenoid-binding protein YceI
MVKFKSSFIAFALLLLTLSAAHAQQAPAAAAAPALPSGVYKMDKNHGYLVFSYLHLGFSHPLLRFTNFDTEIQYDGAKIDNSTAKVTIAVNSIDSGVANLNNELVGDKFLDAAKFPEITFVSTAYKTTGKDTATLTGDLTIKGVTKPVTLDVRLNKAGEHPMSKKPVLGFSATGKFNRSEFGMGMMTPMVGDELSLQFEGEFGLAN